MWTNRKTKQVIVFLIAGPILLGTWGFLGAVLQLSNTLACVITLLVAGLLFWGLSKIGLVE